MRNRRVRVWEREHRLFFCFFVVGVCSCGERMSYLVLVVVAAFFR